MFYRSSSHLPADIQQLLPRSAQEIFRDAFNAAERRYQRLDPSQRVDVAAEIAWAAVNRSYRKRGKGWVPRGATDS